MSDPSAPDEKRPWMSSGPSMYRHPAERLPMDLFSYTREADIVYERDGIWLALLWPQQQWRSSWTGIDGSGHCL